MPRPRFFQSCYSLPTLPARYNAALNPVPTEPLFFITNARATHHRLLIRRRRQWDRPVCQGRGVPVNQDGPRSGPSPICRRSL